MLRAERIDTASTLAPFEKLEADNPDNARTHHAVLVGQWLERPGCRIKLIFLPAHAPHLDAIER